MGERTRGKQAGTHPKAHAYGEILRAAGREGGAVCEGAEALCQLAPEALCH